MSLQEYLNTNESNMRTKHNRENPKVIRFSSNSNENGLEVHTKM